MSTPVAEPQRTALPVVPDASKPAIDYELLLDCVHCGLCTNFCPTYVETGHEADSPRGRIYLMRAVIDNRLELDVDTTRHLDLCLNCRACETACPSGVQYGKLIEPFRLHMEKQKPNRPHLPWLQRQILFKVFPSRRLTNLALFPVRLMQRIGLDRLAERSGLMRLMPGWARSMQGMLPELKAHYGRLPEVLPAEGPRRARVGLFLGCVADGVYPQTNLNTARVLQKNGCEVWIPRSQTCCGALHYHSAIEDEAVKLARANCQAFGATPELDAIITNAAGCGAMLKDYEHLLHQSPDAAAGVSCSRWP